ncbi:bifunctional metallophosphatase/5'-nucleotidase [Ornithinibacillus contaminans]|uniref:bifunctional metallophosphatase/5'-nucleotidase n=1 Tax=Ornithinibacillus contaminans TaxID=694055 RepID=UPI00064D9995|nr:bifunctional UDP-sugar hydrolase/5'-nucleotidase [Ornithinibacillus contaminans]
MEEKIYLYYTNDLHSNFAQWPRVTEYIKQARKKHQVANEPNYVFDIGDHVDRMHPITEAFRGKGNISLLNDAGYDFVTLGNNEGITLSHNELFHLYDEANFQVLCANLHSTAEQSPSWLQPTVRIQTNQGVRIGIIGLTAPFNDYYHLLDWHISDPFASLETYIADLKQSSDIIVLLSHLGISEDQEIARRFKDVDVILGGHTHHLLRTGEAVNQAIITAAGKHCYYIGEVILTWEHQEQKLVKKEAYTTDISDYPMNTQTEERLNELQVESNRILAKPVVTIEEPIEVNWFKTTTIMQRLTEKVHQATNADCAMFNSGLLLDGFQAGTITYGDVHSVCPHPINPCMVELSGAELLEVIRATYTAEFIDLELKGFGFRGKVIGNMVFSGIQVETGQHRQGHTYVETVQVNGSPIIPTKLYNVVTADTFTFGRMLPEIAKSEKKRYILPAFIRDYLAETLQEHYG